MIAWCRALLLACCALLGLGFVPQAWAQDVQPVPELSGRVIDRAGVLSPEQSAALEAKLAAFEREAGPQMVLLLIPSTAPEDIAAYAQRVGDHWKIGRREVGDGLLIVVAVQDRKLRIEVAKALEGAVPDLAARQIIQKDMGPAFKAGDYAGGLNRGVDALQARIRGEHLPAPTDRRNTRGSATDGPGLGTLAMLFFIAVPVAGGLLSMLLGRKAGSLLTAGGTGALGWLVTSSLWLGLGAGLLALMLVGVMGAGGGSARRGGRSGGGSGGPPIIWGGGGSASGGSWGGGDSGGGFSSGGGGDFGGGGASGDW
ncbi:TPM domain-containing protein [Pelomonas sp. CA6]|uniref:TPM domain-containing protein n=1 Tax=Pelomonas sp. CA6 TaxID=2907999 RepID=UPI001F4C1EC7|nr:TPM domain-containing protein [Pelomonas sp. CA6]MCH7345643.1 TPM domain-containing protein [Pelomonas sp. CA6]